MSEARRMQCLQLAIETCAYEGVSVQTLLEAAEKFDAYVRGDRLALAMAKDAVPLGSTMVLRPMTAGTGGGGGSKDFKVLK